VVGVLLGECPAGGADADLWCLDFLSHNPSMQTVLHSAHAAYDRKGRSDECSCSEPGLHGVAGEISSASQHGLKQKDLCDVFGTASIVSEVLSGRRELDKEHIRRLSERFYVSPELFF